MLRDLKGHRPSLQFSEAQCCYQQSPPGLGALTLSGIWRYLEIETLWVMNQTPLDRAEGFLDLQLAKM